MKENTFQLICGGFVILVLISAGAAAPEPASKYLDVSFSLQSPIYLKEPVAIDVLIVNPNPNAIVFDLGWNHQTAFRVSVIAPDGKQFDLPLAKKEGAGIAGPFILDPNEKYSKRLVLNEWYQFDSSGDYHILITLDLPIEFGLTDLPVRPLLANDHQTDQALLDLTILHYNEAALTERCVALFRKVRESRRFPDRSAAAKELSYINDTIAIPYLAGLATEKEESYAIRGLMRIGSDEALEAMIEVTKSTYDKEAAASAKSILRSKINEIHNPTIRERVRAAIE